MVSHTHSFTLLVCFLVLSSSASVTEPPPTPPLPPMTLDEGNGWYLLGPPSSLQSLHTVSLTLSHPQNLHTAVRISYICGRVLVAMVMLCCRRSVLELKEVPITLSIHCLEMK